MQELSADYYESLTLKPMRWRPLLRTQGIVCIGLLAKARCWIGSFQAEAIGRSCCPDSRYEVEIEATK